MNCYFVSCEIAENPALLGKPVVVAPFASRRKSIILTASYEARKYGIKAAMRLSDAERLCKDLVVVDSNMDTYAYYSRLFFEYFLSITPLVEPASIDEGYLDVTDVCEPSNALALAERIQKEMLEKFRLPCSIGIGPNKFLAKMASDMKKPLGITVLRKREIAEKLWPLKVEDLQGVGKKTLPLLHLLNIKTIGDLANFQDMKMLKETIGPTNADALYSHAHGFGSNEVDVNRFTDVSSISNSQTFDNDEYNISNVINMLHVLSNTVCNRLEKSQLKAYTFGIQIRYSNFKTYNRSITLDNPTNDEIEVFAIIKDLFEELYDTVFAVRLVGVSSSKLIKYHEEIRQMSIFDKLDEAEKEHALNNLLADIRKMHGDDSIKIGLKEKNRYNRFDRHVKK